MTEPALPVVFEPRFKPKPWGGRQLAALLGKRLPPDVPIGESWELVSLPGDESAVAAGPLAGRPLSSLVESWGSRLLGNARLVDGRFPLLIKFLDARENLSVQNHPRPPSATQLARAAIKHEAWYVVDAEPNAVVYIGFKPGVKPRDVEAAAGHAAMAELLRPRPARPGLCFYLPSGTPHALGGGVVVAEVQTPSDVTYRLYDWERVGLDGKPRELHLTQAIDNLLYDVDDARICQPRSHIASAFATVTRLAASDAFLIEKVRLAAGVVQPLPHSEMLIWIVLSGSARLVRDRYQTDIRLGDVALIPAESSRIHVDVRDDLQVLEVKIPIASVLAAGDSGQ